MDSKSQCRKLSKLLQIKLNMEKNLKRIKKKKKKNQSSGSQQFSGATDLNFAWITQTADTDNLELHT